MYIISFFGDFQKFAGKENKKGRIIRPDFLNKQDYSVGPKGASETTGDLDTRRI